MAAEATLELLDCRHGTMLVFCSDEVIGRSLRLYGEWSEHELSYLRPFVRAGTTVVDVGANIGTHTLAFARWVEGGRVIAVEPQATVASVLQVNCLLNGISNVEIVNAACAGHQGEACIDAFDPANPGATGFKVDNRFITKLRRLVSATGKRRESTVALVRIDDLVRARLVSLIKIDAEGMEYEVLCGAKAVLRQSHPAIFCEQNDTRQLAAIYDFLVELNYRLFWLETHQFNKANFRGASGNVWWRTEVAILAVHKLAEPPRGLTAVDRNAAKVPCHDDAREGLLVA